MVVGEVSHSNMALERLAVMLGLIYVKVLQILNFVG